MSRQFLQGRSQTLNPGWARKQHFLNFSSFSYISLIFPQFFSIFFLNLGLRVGGPPTREGPGYATEFLKGPLRYLGVPEIVKKKNDNNNNNNKHNFSDCCYCKCHFLAIFYLKNIICRSLNLP